MTQVNFLQWPESIFLNDSSQFSWMTRVNILEWRESIFLNDSSQSLGIIGVNSSLPHRRSTLDRRRWLQRATQSLVCLFIGSSWEDRRKQREKALLTPNYPTRHTTLYLWAHPEFDCLWIQAIYRYWGKNRSNRVTSIVSHSVIPCRLWGLARDVPTHQAHNLWKVTVYRYMGRDGRQ